MRYDPQRHHRHSIRLRGYDYSQPGAYFVTILVRHRERILSRIIGGAAIHTAVGEAVHD